MTLAEEELARALTRIRDYERKLTEGFPSAEEWAHARRAYIRALNEKQTIAQAIAWEGRAS